MHSLFKRLLINSLALAVLAYLAPGFSYQNDLKVLILGAFVLALINTLLRPLLKVLLLPLNVITFGILGWFINVIILYLVVSLVPGLSISGFTLVLGATNLVLSPFLAYIFLSFSLNLILSVISWILGD